MPPLDVRVCYGTADDGSRLVALTFDATDLNEAGIRQAVAQTLNQVQSKLLRKTPLMVLDQSTIDVRVAASCVAATCKYYAVEVRFQAGDGNPRVEMEAAEGMSAELREKICAAAEAVVTGAE